MNTRDSKENSQVKSIIKEKESIEKLTRAKEDAKKILAIAREKTPAVNINTYDHQAVIKATNDAIKSWKKETVKLENEKANLEMKMIAQISSVNKLTKENLNNFLYQNIFSQLHDQHSLHLFENIVPNFNFIADIILLNSLLKKLTTAERK
ncbi:MAG: hypothetical protein JO149_05215, partial [Gammaproteobacteria bacterium]|nr:hypothetical protein [Gammaproteobacteria bacterium]